MKQDAPGTLKYGNQPCGETDSMGWITIKRTGCHFVTINLTGDVSDSKLNLSFKHSRFNLTRQITENQHTSSREDGLFDSSVISASFLGLFTKGDKLCVQLNEGTTSAFDGNTSIAFMGHMVESEENAVAFYAERNTPLLIQTIVTYNFETGNIKDGCFVAPRNGKEFEFDLLY